MYDMLLTHNTSLHRKRNKKILCNSTLSLNKQPVEGGGASGKGGLVGMGMVGELEGVHWLGMGRVDWLVWEFSMKGGRCVGVWVGWVVGLSVGVLGVVVGRVGM